MREGLRVRELANDEGNRLLRIVRRCSGSVVTWRRAQMVLLSARGMDITQIARVAFTSPDRVREVINNFNDKRIRVALPEVRGRAAANVHVGSTTGDQEDRVVPPGGSRPAVLDGESVEAGRVLGG